MANGAVPASARFRAFRLFPPFRSSPVTSAHPRQREPRAASVTEGGWGSRVLLRSSFPPRSGGFLSSPSAAAAAAGLGDSGVRIDPRKLRRARWGLEGCWDGRLILGAASFGFSVPASEGIGCAKTLLEFTETNLKLPNRVQPVGGNGKTNDGKFRRKQPLLEEKPYSKMSGGIDCDGAAQQDLTRRLYNEDDKGVHRENMTSVPTVKQRRCMETNEDEVGGGYQNPFGVENDCEGLGQLGAYKLKKKRRKEIETNNAISKYCVERQCNCCSKPIDKPTWSVIFKIDGKEYISLAGHWSTKSCEKVRELSLQSVVQVTKVPRLEAWPNIWKASKPTGDNIGMYFFPHELRHDEELDQLVKEVIDKDLVLQAVIGEAEMLIFSSVLLPERYQTFQTNHYLWAAFKAKEDKGAATVEQEEDREKQHVSSQLDEVQSEESDQEMILMKCAKPLENQPSRSIQEVETCCIQGPTNMCLENESLEERRLRGSSHQAACNSASTAIFTDATTVAKAATAPSEAASFAANTASFPANHRPMDPSSCVFGIVIRRTPNIGLIVQEFLDEMRRVDGLVAVMQGEEIVPTSGQANTTAMQ